MSSILQTIPSRQFTNQQHSETVAIIRGIQGHVVIGLEATDCPTQMESAPEHYFTLGFLTAKAAIGSGNALRPGISQR
jgi:hypothetical protein